ncbi:dihydroxyacetone kinase [Parachaetomium inaequale]|uniref:Dihydroxyacetone kinase n=1 Tax=Parachaetomium inaequale TaxID=2588326 RepID=A0AAN6SN08_9PEZI|nr:dihydroxyacetone kinase [Parachaetomium inaequale]
MTRGKHFINGTDDLVMRLLRSLLVNDKSLRLIPEKKVLYRQQCPGERKVIVVSGGGSGHEPAHAGFVGEGMLDVAVAGNIFASPSAPQILAGIQALDAPLGTLLITKNYTGDKLNFGLAAEQAKASGRVVRIVVVEDDVSIRGNELVGRRGLAGTAFVHKIAGAAAAKGLSLDEVARVAQKTADSLATAAVSLDRCSVPQREEQDGLDPDVIEYGMGIHNEPGAERGKLTSLQETVARLLSILVSEHDDRYAPFRSSEVAVMINNLGGLSVLELQIAADEILGQLGRQIPNIRRVFIGTFVTALDGPGVSVTLFGLDSELDALLAAPTTVNAWPKSASGYSQAELEQQIVPAPAKAPHAAENGSVPRLPLPREVLQNVLLNVAQNVQRDEPLITKYDTIAGDGDCGTTLLTGVNALTSYAKRISSETLDLAVTFAQMASIIQETMGGTSGAIYAIFFNAVSNSLGKSAASVGSRHLHVPHSMLVAEALQQGLDELCKYTSARVGSRTIMDALIPFVETLHENPEDLGAAVAAASVGAERTRRMDAKLGRESYVAKDQLDLEEEGIPDPGALGVVSVLEGVVAGDERRPVCGQCYQKGDACEWGIRLSFRDENVQTIPQNHPSMRHDTASRRDGGLEIVDITNEVIRDYWSEVNATEEALDQHLSDSSTTNRHMNNSSDSCNTSTLHRFTNPDFNTSNRNRMAADSPTSFPSPQPRRSRLFNLPISMELPGDAISPGFAEPNNDSPASLNTPHSYDLVQLAAVQLLDLGTGPQTHNVGSQLLPPLSNVESNNLPEEVAAAGLSPEQLFAGDGIFLPGSAYLELHSALRNHIFDTARSTYPSRWPTPSPAEARLGGGDEGTQVGAQQTSHTAPDTTGGQGEETTELLSDTTPRFIELTNQEEYVLWKNWVDEIAPWLDKFDKESHFQQKLTARAKVHSHLRFSMLALSARQLERKHPERSSSASLALYQEAVHQLVPQLQTKLTDVVASCVVLCVLEMMSYVCGGLISSESPLIPSASWTPRMPLADAVNLFRSAPGSDMYANLAVFLSSQALELFACDDSDAEFTRRWNELFAHIEGWYTQRPPAMRSILSQPAATENDPPSASPFPTLLFSNAPAISGNQLYHTAALLMLQRKPRRAVLPPKTRPRPILWHARRICAISISNTHHGCWTNCVQPLWIAGQVMSHHAEHRAILETYERIEKETGWGANWRAEDLKAHWGQLDEG